MKLRPALIWTAVLVGVILASVRVGSVSNDLDERLATLKAEQEREREQIQVLLASFAHLTAADQLRPLAERHLELEPIRGDQMVLLQDLPKLPPLPLARKLSPGEEADKAPAPEQFVAPGERKPIEPRWDGQIGRGLLQPVTLREEERSR